MRVIEARDFGGPEVLTVGEAPDPAPGPGEAVIAVAAADVLFVETQIRRGLGREWFDHAPPYVPGNGVAGAVIAVGEGVERGWLGRRAVAHTGERGGAGGYAERALVPAAALIAVPEGLGLGAAAALLHDGPTALALIEGIGVRPGEWALVMPAGGGLGILLVQLARAAGARVVAAGRGERKLALARELGAVAAVDYSLPGWAERVRGATGGAGPSLVLDGVGGEIGREAFAITAPGGRFSGHGGPSGDFASVDPGEARRRSIAVSGIERVQLAPAEHRGMTERALAEAAAGRIRPVIGQTFPLERAAEAHAAIEARATIGKTLLLVGA